ncbi:electron transporter RnfG [Steroidobacter denitrificans]|uniref:Ion-translocating oxidoreductase complex subunit G n=1 Tax=Steroidobacter denitrificans TaxID=465721 RepID=A0A127F9L7_STEDE|nr:RnfABCDGE type electron transport complex subunit G [Steroidobacter denitrificans]AMN46295.1 electron transporter RnfG [Steroidobacter denitrificans]
MRTERPTTVPPAPWKQAVVIILLAASIGAVLAGIAHCTRDHGEHDSQAWIREHLEALLPAQLADNDPLNDRLVVTAPDMLGTTRPVTIYRARRAGEPTAIVMRTVAPGYRGPIELLVAIDCDGTLIGVRVLNHDETPGLGDAFEQREPQWLQRFSGLSLSHPPQARWALEHDGGDFDALTGATITSRAIVTAVRRALEYHQQERVQLCGIPARPDRAPALPSSDVPADSPGHSPAGPAGEAP